MRERQPRTAAAPAVASQDLAPHADRVVAGLGELVGRLAELAGG